MCDLVDNCGYGEDESNSLQCKNSTKETRELTVGYIVAPFLLLVVSICITAIIICFCRRVVKQHTLKNQNFPPIETKNPNYYNPVINKLSSNFTKNNCNEPILDVDYTKNMVQKDEWFV